MLFFHFTSEGHAKSVCDKVRKFPFHLTTDVKRGTTYGSHAAVFKVEGEFKCHVGRVTRSKYANGMIEYVIRDEAELASFLDVVQSKGVRHCIQLRGL